MKAFYVINDSSHIVIWDDLILTHVPTFPTCPKDWKEGRCADMTEGDWTLACGLHQMASPAAYQKAGIPEPTFAQIPAVFCVSEKGVEGQYNVTAEQAATFIKERI